MRRWPLLTLLLGATLLTWRGGREAPQIDASLPLAAPATAEIVPDLELLSSGGVARLSDWRGSYLLILFGYSTCPDVCPLALAQLAALIERLDAGDDLQVLLITVDPERDTPARLAEYLGRFHPSFVGLSGSGAQIHEAMTAFHALAQRADPLVLHTDAVALVDRDGRLLALYGQSALSAGSRFDEATLAALEGRLRAALGVAPPAAGDGA